MADEPVDLIRLEGHGNSVILRVTGAQDGLSGEFLIQTPFVRGSLRAPVFAEDLWEWRDALDGLDTGHDIAWRDGGPRPPVYVERDGDLALVTIKDPTGSATTVTVTVLLTDRWFDDAYERLDLTLKTWPMAER